MQQSVVGRICGAGRLAKGKRSLVEVFFVGDPFWVQRLRLRVRLWSGNANL